MYRYIGEEHLVNVPAFALAPIGDQFSTEIFYRWFRFTHVDHMTSFKMADEISLSEYCIFDDGS